MRRRNMRLVYAGALLLVLAAGFFFGMTLLIPKSNDPVSMMRTVGQVAGAGGGIGMVLIVVGLIGRRV